MSINFNIALLRSLKDPLMDSLKKLHNQLQEVLDGKREIKAFEGASEAHLVVGSLGMINARGARVIAETIETLVGALQNTSDPRFQNMADLHQGLRAAQQGIKSLESYLGGLINSEEDQPVKLWSPWSRMVMVLGQHEPNPDALFFPAPSFDDETFQPIQANDLKMTVEAARRRLDEGATQWANADSAMPADAGLRQVLTVVDELYNLRHRKGYQGYWLALSARVQAALLHPQQERDDKRPLGATLDQASVELRKFAEDQKRVSDDTLREVVLPLVNVRTLEWAGHHPVFASLDRRFGLREFLHAAHQSADAEGQARLEAFAHRHQEFKDNLNTIKVEWARQIGVASDKRNLVKGLTVLLQKREAFPGEAAPLLLNALAQLSEHYTNRLGDLVGEGLGAEVATLLVMADAVIDRRGQMSSEFVQQCDLQKRRVLASLAGRSEELGAMPHAAWDHQTKNEQARQAMRHVVQEVKKDLAHIEKILDDVLRDRDDSLDHLDEVEGHAKVAAGALRIMNQTQAVRVLDGVRATVASFGKKGHTISDQERVHVTVGLGSLTVFLNAYESGDPRARRLLAPALKTLFNEDLPEEDDTALPSLVPSSAPVDHTVTPDLPEDPDASVAPVIPPRFDAPEPLPPLVEPEPVHAVPAPAGITIWTTNPDAPLSHDEPSAPDASPSSDTVPVGDSPAPSPDSPDLPGWDESSDAMIAEVFLEEALEALTTVRTEVDTLDRRPNDHDALTTVRRQFHTLKGSGRMAQFFRLAAVAWLIEERLNEVLETGAPMTPALHEVIGVAVDAITGWIDTLAADQQRPDRADDEPLRVWVDGSRVRELLAAGQPDLAHVTHEDTGPSFAASEASDADPLPETDEPSLPSDGLEEPGHDHAAHDAPADHVQTGAGDDLVWIGAHSLPHHLFELFASDAREHVDLLLGDVAAWYLENGGWTVSEGFVRSAHTLRSLGRTVDLPALAELGGALEARVEQAFHTGEELTVETVEILEDAVNALRDMVSGIVKHRTDPAPQDGLVERLKAITTPATSGTVLPDHDAEPASTEPALGVDEGEHEPDGAMAPQEPAPNEALPPSGVEALPVAPAAPDHQEPTDAEPAGRPVPRPEPSGDIAEPRDPWDDALDALGVIAEQVQRLTIAFEALANRR